jgi:hypothetical protein
MMVSLRKWILSVAVVLLAGLSAIADPPAMDGGIMQGSCGSCSEGCGRGMLGCHHLFCGPPYRHCVEGPPHLRFKCGCPLPVCPPNCDTPNWGYYQPCWNPWPWPPDWSHCPVRPPASQVLPGNEIIVPTPLPSGKTQQELPAPRKF